MAKQFLAACRYRSPFDLPPGTGSPLMRLDASTALPVSANRRRLYECCPPSPTVTAGNEKTQAIESKHVINRELWVALQFPIGDDVSAHTRCKAAQAFYPTWSPATVYPLN